MSLESAGQFAKLVIENESVRQQVDATVAGKPQPEVARAVSELAASLGYQFTPDEGYAVSQQVAAAMKAGPVELSEEELDSVAGGLTSGFTSTYVSQTAGAAASNLGSIGPAGVGAPVGAIVQGAVNGYMTQPYSNQSAAGNAAIGAGQGYNSFQEDVKSVFNTIFSGW